MTTLRLGPQAAERLAHAVSERFGLPFLPGTRHILVVKQTRTHAVVIYPMIANWRLATAPLRDLTGVDRAWCYTGTKGFWLAFTQAQFWPDDDDGGHVPHYWYRDAVTDERRKEFLFP